MVKKHALPHILAKIHLKKIWQEVSSLEQWEVTTFGDMCEVVKLWIKKIILVMSGVFTPDSTLTSKVISFPSSREVLCCTQIMFCYEGTPEKSHIDSSIVRCCPLFYKTKSVLLILIWLHSNVNITDTGCPQYSLYFSIILIPTSFQFNFDIVSGSPITIITS